MRSPSRPGLSPALLRFEDCRFEGPYKSAVDLASSVGDVEFTRNRFHNVADGFHYRTAVPRHRIHLTLGNNPFHKVTRAGLPFTAMPLSDNNSRIVIKDNLFISTAALVQVDGTGNPQPKTNAHWIWINEGDPLKTAPAGDCYFRKTFQLKAPDQGQVALNADDAYELYVNGRLVSKSGDQPSQAIDVDSDSPLRIGFGNLTHFSGALSDVRLYRGALSENEIAKLAQEK